MKTLSSHVQQISPDAFGWFLSPFVGVDAVKHDSSFVFVSFSHFICHIFCVICSVGRSLRVVYSIAPFRLLSITHVYFRHFNLSIFSMAENIAKWKSHFFLFLPSEFSLFSFGRGQKKWREMRFHFIICCKCVPFSLLMATYLALFALKLCHVVSHDRHMSFSLSACEELNLFVEPVAVANLLIIFATWQQLN